ncbi:MAG TPA: hypothetical protein VNE83_00565, partial [Terriglobales bacterium]|nr:hypothetical protein [Terriglobales bacterium]
MNLGPKLIPKMALKQTLTPGLVQMVNILAMNKLDLQEAISQELLENPLLDETQDEASPSLDELMRLEQDLEASTAVERNAPASDGEAGEPAAAVSGGELTVAEGNRDSAAAADPDVEAAAEAAAEAGGDAFEEIDYGDFFKDYLDPGFQKVEREEIDRPSFDNFLSAPTTLSDHLRWQLSVEPIEADMRAAAEAVIGNLDEDG